VPFWGEIGNYKLLREKTFTNTIGRQRKNSGKERREL